MGESFKFILDCALSEEAPYFSVLNVLNVQIWRLIYQMREYTVFQKKTTPFLFLR